VSADYEYITSVFGIGLEGFSDYDHDELNAFAELGWEPYLVTGVHNGFAALILFRRLLPGRGRTAARKAPAKKTAAKQTAAKKTAAKKTTAQTAAAKTAAKEVPAKKAAAKRAGAGRA